jgi:hypothetical protein
MTEDQFLRRARVGPRLAWPLLALVLVSMVAFAGGIRWGHAALVVIPTMALFTLGCESSWFVVKAAPLRTWRIWRILLSHSAAAAVLSAAWMACLLAWGAESSRLVGVPDLVARIRGQIPLLFALGVFYYLLVTAYYYLIVALDSSREASEREAAARLLARDSELKALRAQINPHFLFNSLHSISALTSIDPPAARSMCILLGDYLRNTLGLSEKRRIRFEEELRLARQYLAVEQVRFGNRMNVEETVDPSSFSCLLPPLLLQPLVENAIKHGVATMTNTAQIRLDAGIRDGWLSIGVSNDYDSEAKPKPGNGVGLSNVRERLNAAYGDAAEMNSGGQNGRWRVNLRLPAEKGEQV